MRCYLQAIHKSFLCKIFISHKFKKVFSIESFLLYGNSLTRQSHIHVHIHAGECTEVFLDSHMTYNSNVILLWHHIHVHVHTGKNCLGYSHGQAQGRSQSQTTTLCGGQFNSVVHTIVQFETHHSGNPLSGHPWNEDISLNQDTVCCPSYIERCTKLIRTPPLIRTL